MNREERLERIKKLEKRLDRQYRYYLTIKDPIESGDYIGRMDETLEELRQLDQEEE